MKTMLYFRYVLCLLIVSLSFNIAHADFNDDKLVERAVQSPIQKIGTLKEIAEKNLISIDHKTTSLGAVIAKMGLDAKKTSVIESYAIMRWSVKRIRVSEKYEILVQFGVSANGIEEVISASIIPHVERLFYHNLSNQKNWSIVKYANESKK